MGDWYSAREASSSLDDFHWRLGIGSLLSVAIAGILFYAGVTSGESAALWLILGSLSLLALVCLGGWLSVFWTKYDELDLGRQILIWIPAAVGLFVVFFVAYVIIYGIKMAFESMTE